MLLLSLWVNFIISLCVGVTYSRDDHCLLIFLLDGMRWDYLDRENLEGFARIAGNGVRAEYVRPVYPSNSYPNWYTIATGLYAENHGIVDNFMYDADHDDYFLMAPDKGVFKEHWWNNAEPLWITAEKNGITTSMYNWVGCEININGYKASRCETYKIPYFWPSVKLETREAAFKMLDQFENNSSRLGMIYYEPVDASGHHFGPNSFITRYVVRDIDSVLNSVQDEIERRGLDNKVNIVIVSDHGMTTKTISRTTTISLDDVISPGDIKVMLNVNYNSMIWPVKGKENEVYQKLVNANKKGLNVYKKEDLPEEYHYQNYKLIAPIILLADKDYNIIPLRNAQKVKPYFPLGWITTYFQPGVHGFDPYSNATMDMQTIFLARGPGFKKGFLAPPLEMVDHYNIFCHVLGMQPLPNNGSWHRVKEFLQDIENYNSSEWTTSEIHNKDNLSDLN